MSQPISYLIILLSIVIFLPEQRIYPSSYQLRFGARSRASAGYG